MPKSSRELRLGACRIQTRCFMHPPLPLLLGSCNPAGSQSLRTSPSVRLSRPGIGCRGSERRAQLGGPDDKCRPAASRDRLNL
jgi:hypothetical protein